MAEHKEDTHDVDPPPPRGLRFDGAAATTRREGRRVDPLQAALITTALVPRSAALGRRREEPTSDLVTYVTVTSKSPTRVVHSIIRDYVTESQSGIEVLCTTMYVVFQLINST